MRGLFITLNNFTEKHFGLVILKIWHRYTNTKTDKWTLPNVLYHCSAVNKNSMISSFHTIQMVEHFAAMTVVKLCGPFGHRGVSQQHYCDD